MAVAGALGPAGRRLPSLGVGWTSELDPPVPQELAPWHPPSGVQRGDQHLCSSPLSGGAGRWRSAPGPDDPLAAGRCSQATSPPALLSRLLLSLQPLGRAETSCSGHTQAPGALGTCLQGKKDRTSLFLKSAF